jgi:hypothetical protein
MIIIIYFDCITIYPYKNIIILYIFIDIYNILVEYT